MTKQPKALELAEHNANLIDKLRRTPMRLADLIPHLQQMGDELRRLHALLVEAKPMLEEFGGTPAYDLIDRIDALGEGEKK